MDRASQMQPVGLWPGYNMVFINVLDQGSGTICKDWNNKVNTQFAVNGVW